MSDLVKGFVLGQVSEGYFKDMERTAASLVRPRAASGSAPAIDLEGILRAAQEADAYIQKLERSIEALQQENGELRANLARAESDRDKLNAWADWAEAELGRRPKGS